MTCARPATTAAEMNAAVFEGMGVADGFRTIRIPDGRWLSFAGDTTRPGEVLPAYDNSVIVWDNLGQRRVATPDDPHGNFFPRWPDDSEFWPNQPVIVGGQLYVLGSRLIVNGAWDYTDLGSYGAVVELARCGVPRFLRYFVLPSSGQGGPRVQWGAGLTRTASYVYVHGARDAGPTQYGARDGGYVARVPATALESLSAWRYWTGAWWSPTVTAAISTIHTPGGTESGYTLHRRPDGQWAVHTKRGGGLSGDFGRYSAPFPWGPWTWQSLLSAGDLDCYLSGAADTIPTANGALLAYWSRPGLNPLWTEVAP